MDVKDTLSSLLHKRLEEYDISVEASQSSSFPEEFDFYVADQANRTLAVLVIKHKQDEGKVRIDYVCVGKPYLRQGIGTKIVGCVEDLAREIGMDDVYINSSLNDQFWKKRGYVPMHDTEEWDKRLR